jgi:hypothetical protein
MTPMQPDQPITITLQAQQWNVVLNALAEAPWRIADPVMRELTRQTAAAQQALDEPQPPAKPNGDAREIEAHAA